MIFRSRFAGGSRTATGSRSRPPAGYYYDEEQAESAVYFIENRCIHWQAPFNGVPFILAPFQRRIVEDVYGWKKRKDGSRRYRWVYVEVPKGNGKTPLGAALVLLAIHWSMVIGAEVYSVAGDREQARLVYNDAKGMTLQSADLTSRTNIYTNSLVVPVHNSVYKCIAWSREPRGPCLIGAGGSPKDRVNSILSMDL